MHVGWYVFFFFFLPWLDHPFANGTFEFEQWHFLGSDHQKKSNSESLRQFYLLFCHILQCDAPQLQLGLVGPPDAWSNLGHLAGWSPTAGDISAVKLEYIHISVIFSSMVINQESIFHPYFRISSHINIRRFFFSMGLLWTISYELIINLDIFLPYQV